MRADSGKVYLHQAYCWYYYIQLDFTKYYRHAEKWVRLFEEHPEAKKDDPSLYTGDQLANFEHFHLDDFLAEDNLPYDPNDYYDANHPREVIGYPSGYPPLNAVCFFLLNPFPWRISNKSGASHSELMYFPKRRLL